jgi:hypothetical protein
MLLYLGKFLPSLITMMLIYPHSLGDPDDDVRSVAASCLLPVASHLVEHLPESLERVLSILWSCLADMKDDLSSSVGAVMDLLGKYFMVGFVYIFLY